jgi:hypothetical protein
MAGVFVVATVLLRNVVFFDVIRVLSVLVRRMAGVTHCSIRFVPERPIMR